MKDKPRIIKGDLAIDDRGSVRFVNEFNFEGVKRFYQVANHERGFIRAWHGHQKEGKFAYVVKGSALIGVIDLDAEPMPDKFIPSESAFKFVLSDKKTSILWIPAGYYNGFMSLEEDTILMFFSTSSLEESLGDDIRQPFNRFNLWDIEYR
ncbi:MAG: dTDP-4-dehydrorhamnose 3,5-epimerase family protein [Bacteroidota bacterium]